MISITICTIRMKNDVNAFVKNKMIA